MELQAPAELAEAYYQLHAQPSSVWTQELQLSPSREGIGMRL